MTVVVDEGVSPRWAPLAHDAPMLATPGWLRAMDGRLGPRPLTFLVSSADRVVLAAFASVQTVPRPGEFFDPHHILIAPTADFPLTDAARAARTDLSRTAPGPEAWLPSLVVMLPGYECVPVGPAADDAAALRELVAGALAWAADEGIANVLFLYLRPEQTALADALRDNDFTAFPLTYTWDLPLPGHGLDDYLRALPNKRRRDTGREMRALAASGVTLSPAPVESVFDDLVRLRCQLVRKYRHDVDVDRERVRLRTMIDVVAGGKPVVLTATADGALLSFAMFGPTGTAWTCLAVGSDYSDPRHRLAYFHTTYVRAAEAAYAAGAESIGYGQGAWQAKRARGCHPTRMTGWLHTSDPALAATARASAAITELVAL